MIKKVFLFLILVTFVSFPMLEAMQRRKNNPGQNALDRRNSYRAEKKRAREIISTKAKKKIESDTTCTCRELTSICLFGTLGCACGICIMNDPEVVKNSTSEDLAEETYFWPVFLTTAAGSVIGKFVYNLFDRNKKTN